MNTITESSLSALIAAKLAEFEGPQVDPGSMRRKVTALLVSAASRFASSRSSKYLTKEGTTKGSAAWSATAPIKGTRNRPILMGEVFQVFLSDSRTDSEGNQPEHGGILHGRDQSAFFGLN